MVSGVKRIGSIKKPGTYQTVSRPSGVISVRGGGGSGGTTTTERTDEQRQVWFESRGITDTVPIGRTISGALLFQTRGGKIVSTTDMSLLTESGKDYVSLTTKTRAEAGAEIAVGTLSPQALGKPILNEMEEESRKDFVVLEPYKSLTAEQIAEGRRVSFTNQPGFFDTVGESYQATFFPEIIGSFASFLGFGKEKDYQQEAFEYAPTKADFPSGTLIYAPRKDVDLSEGALLYRQEIAEEVPRQIRIQQEIMGKKEEILGRISPGGITEAEALMGTKQLKEFTEMKWEGYEKGHKQRAEEREESVFKTRHPYEFKAGKFIRSKTPDFFDFDPYKKEKDVFETLDFGGAVGGSLAGFGGKLTSGGLSFGKGAYEGIRTRPIKTVVTAGIVGGVSFVTSGLGTAGAVGTYGAGIMKVAKPLQYTLGGAYGASVIGRVALAGGGRHGKFEQAGEIFGTEILPMGFGYKVGSYGGRRVGLYYERGQVLKGKSKLLPKDYVFDDVELAKIQKEYKISQALKGTQPKVKELDFTGMERITPKQQDIIKSFLLSKQKKIVLGGTSGTRGQLLTKEIISPHDIDIFVKGFRQKVTADVYSKELAGLLKLKAKGGAIRGVGGEKIIEFKPFGEYLAPNIQQVAPFYRTSKAGIIKSPEGFNVLRLDYQAQQKILGFGRYGAPRTKDIIWYFTQGKPTLLKQAQLETVGSKVFDVKMITGQTTAPKGVTFLGATGFEGASRKPMWIELRQDLKPSVKKVVLTHELIHAKHPFWSEAKVRSIETASGFKEVFIPKMKGIKHLAVKEITYPSYPKGLPGAYPSYPSYKPMFDITPYPSKKQKKIIPSQYKPSKDTLKTFYPGAKGSYSPYPTTPKTPPGKYKPFELDLALIPPTTEEIIPTKKKDMFLFGSPKVGVKKKTKPLPERIFQPTPSYKAVYGKGLGFKTPKFSKALQQTGIVERKYIAPKIIKPLGPFKV